MRYVLILLLLVGTAYGQSSPTSAKTRFVNGLYMGTKLDSYFNTADSNAIYWRADSVVMAKYKGTARALAFASALGDYKLISDTLFNNGYTTRGRTKQGLDSLGVLKLNISDTAAMLANRLKISDTASMLLPFVQYSDTAAIVAGYVLNNRFLDSLTNVQTRIQTKQPLGAYITLADSTTILAGRWLPNRSADSIAVIRALANTKLNISDTASMLANRLKISDTLTMLSGLSLDRVLANGNTSGRGVVLGTGSFTSSGSSNTVEINHSSGSGIALNITKGGNDEGLYVNKTSGSGNAATIIGTLNATALVKSGGTSSQFLMADGSVNTSVLPSGAYLPLSGGTLTGALNGTSAAFSGAGSFASVTSSGSGSDRVIMTRTGIGTYHFSISGDDRFSIYDPSADLERLSITSSGNVGIGSASPATNLQVSSTNSIIRISNTTSGLSNADLDLAVTNAGLARVWQYGQYAMVFGTANTERMRISSGGNTLIKTTTDNGTDALQVAGSGLFSGQLTMAYGGTPRLLLRDTDAGAGNVGILFRENTTDEWTVASVGGDFQIFNEGGLGNALLINGTTNAATFSSLVRAQTQFKAKNNGSNLSYLEFEENGNTNSFTYIAGDARNTSGFLKFYTSDAVRLTIAGDGAATFSSTVSATGFIVSSDRRLKNIVSRSGDMVTYTLKADKNKILHYGYIAQEVEKVLPTTVSTDDKGMKAVNYIEVLVKKVNDLEKEIAELKKHNK